MPSQSLSQSADRDPTVKYFWLLVAAHFVLWTLVCWLTQPNMPLDMVEMLSWGQQWQLGYHKHPPLPAWIAATTWWLGGGNEVFMYAVSQVTIVTTFWAAWQLAREGLSPRAALCSVVLLQGCYYCTYMINDINNTIITRPFWALAILFLYRALTRESSSARNLNWILTGLVIGLGMISKYYLGVLVLTMMFIPVFLPASRSSLKTAGPYLLAAVAFLVFTPHLIWMFQNDFITIQYVFRRSGEQDAGGGILNHLIAPVSFIASQVGAVLPMLVLAWPMLREKRIRKEPEATDTDQQSVPFRKYVTIVFVGPIVVYLLVALIMGASIRSMWGGPLFSFLGVWLFSFFELPEDPKQVRKILRDSMIIGFCMLVALAARNLIGPSVRGKLSRVHFPGIEAAEAINERWQSEFGTELNLIGGDMFLTASVSVYSPQQVDIFAELSEVANPWLSIEKFESRGGIIVWEIADENKNPPLGWMKKFPTAKRRDPIHLESQAVSGPRDVTVGVLVVPPSRSGSSQADPDRQ